MIDYYVEFWKDHWIAVCVFLLQLGIRPIVRHYNLRPDDEELKPWVKRYRNISSFPKGIMDGILLTVTSLTAEWYILDVALPMFAGNALSQLFSLVWIAILIGVGLSIGKSMTEQDYKWYQR